MEREIAGRTAEGGVKVLVACEFSGIVSQATKGKNNPRWKGGISKTYQRRQGGLCEC